MHRFIERLIPLRKLPSKPNNKRIPVIYTITIHVEKLMNY